MKRWCWQSESVTRSDIALWSAAPLDRPTTSSTLLFGLNPSCHGYDVISFSSMIGQAPWELTQVHGPVSSGLSPADVVQVSRSAPQEFFIILLKNFDILFY